MSPLPAPKKQEDKEKFLERCLSDDLMNDEYPDNKQRYAVCLSLWNERKNYEDNKMEFRKALAVHHTATTDAAWDGPAMKTNLKNDGSAEYYRQAFAWVDPDADPKTKTAYKFIHHMVGSNGNIGAASISGCRMGIGVLNGARGGTVIPDADKRGVYNHLAAHLKDADLEPAELKSIDDEEIERRFVDIGEFRIDNTNANKNKLIGYPAVFNKWSVEMPSFREKINAGAFENTLKNDDIRALYNHKPEMPLGRISAGNLILKEDRHGLYMELEPTDTSYARDLKVNIAAGVINQMSIGFRTVKDEWKYSEDKNKPIERIIQEVQLFDVSPVTYSAYSDTTIALRHLQAMNIASEEKNRNNDYMYMRLRLEGEV